MTLAFAGVFALAAALTLVLVMRSASSYTERRIADAVMTDLKGFEDVFAQSGLAGLKEAMERRLSWDPNRIYMLVDQEANIIAGNTRQWPNNASEGGGRITVVDRDHNRTFDGATRVLPGGVKLLLAHDRREHDKILAGMWRGLALPMLAILLATLAGGYWLTRRVLARIERVNETCRAVENGDMAARVAAVDGRGDEFDALGAHVNAMLDRIERLMASVQHLSDHIAHETRTPLARLRNRLERARSEAGVNEASRAAFEDAIGETETIISVFSALLDITAAESAAGDARGLKQIDLSETVADVLDLYEGVAEDRGVTLRAQTVPATVLGDATLLMRMVANVVDNAIKFSPEGGEVTMQLAINGSEAVLTVADQGPGMPEGFAGSAFERFSRADEAKSKPGHGLGLPLVRAIAIRHGIKVTMENGHPGLTVTFRCPLAGLIPN